MEKTNFKYLYSFKYKNKDYIYLISKNYPFYFLEYNNKTKNFDYPDINTFKDLYNKFYSNENIYAFDIKEELKKLKIKLSHIDFNMEPLIKTTTGLLSLAIVLSMCGCTQTNTLNNTTNQETTSIIETQGKDQEIYNYFKEYNMEVTNREYDGNDYIFVSDFINNKNKHQITIHTFEEFRKLTNINFTPTWNDVIEVFKNNKNIDEEKKDIILECIDNLKTKKELKGMDLSVLYVNAKKMKFEYLSNEELRNRTDRDSVYAYFEPTTGTVYLPKDKTLEKFEFIHEVLGHGALAYREETQNTLTVFDCTNYIMLPTDNRYTGYSMGQMVSEGGANLIAHYATDDYSVSTFYELYEEELRVIANLCNVSIGELFNHKGISLYDLMYKNNINTPVEYIFKMDGVFKGQLYCEFSDLMERLLLDATEEKISTMSKEQQEKLIASTIEMIKNTHLNKKELNFNYTGGSINYNFEETANNFEENMNGLKRSK